MSIHQVINWPPNYTQVFVERSHRLAVLRKGPEFVFGAEEYYKHRPIEFIEHFCDTVDPRNAGDDHKLVRMPFILFPRQKDMVNFLYQCFVLKNNGLIEKCRDFGATWVCAGFSVWLWRFYPGSAVGWGSRKEDLVDKLGDMSSIFEKMRAIIEGLPVELLPFGFDPKKHMTYMKIINPANGATIIGESGDEIGRGGRTTLFFKDESGHYERPEKIQAALDDNTNVQIDISSVNGLGNVFHRRRESGIEWQSMIPMDVRKIAVFVADWSDHPDKTQEWYDKRRQDAIDQGMLHKFEQEVCRNYAASVAGVIISATWVRAAIGAAELLGFEDSGDEYAALDPADDTQDGDLHAVSYRKGVVLKDFDTWGGVDTGASARRSINFVRDRTRGKVIMMYDSIGVGAGVKGEFNRMSTDPRTMEMMKTFTFSPWAASAKVLWPEQRSIKGDKESRKNKDQFANLKGQGWYALAMRFYRTWRAVEAHKTGEYFEYDVDDLISISPDIPKEKRLQLEKELSQAVRKADAPKFAVDKKPSGTKSPNIADSVVMNYFPNNTAVYNIANW